VHCLAFIANDRSSADRALRRHPPPALAATAFFRHRADNLGDHLACSLDLYAIPDAQVETRGTKTKGTGDALQSILQNLHPQMQAQWNLLRTDAEGRIVIPFVPVTGVTRTLALKWEGGRSTDFPLEAGVDWLVVHPR